MLKNVSLALILMISYAVNASEPANVSRGKDLAEYCMGCHGEFGIAEIDSNPNLAGQNAKYLEYALKSYRDGVRKGGMAFIMQANAGKLSDQDIRDLAAYFSGLPGRQPTSIDSPNEQVSQ